MDPRVGTEFAGHRIESVIGRGGASVVYLAEHLRLGRKVALKVLAPHLADDEAFRERFIRESRIAAGLDHPNIVTVFDAGEVEGSLYISMRYVEGRDLKLLLEAERALEAEGGLEPARAISILSQVASALDAAHAQGLVHRDVKPANILVASTEDLPDFERAYLSDFGISKRTTSREGLTRTGQFVGTVDYVAPEQITGDPVDGRTDVYSLGCVLFECLSGQVPFPGETGVATIYSHLHDRPPSLEGVGEWGKRLDRVMGKALAKSKESRYDACGAMMEAVRHELAATAPTIVPVADRPGERAPGAHRPGRSGRWTRRRVGAVSAAGVVVVVVAVALAFALPGGGGTPPAQRTGATGATVGETGSSGPTTPSEAAPSFVWSQAYALERTGLSDAAMNDAAVVGTTVVAVGHATPGGTTSKLGDAAAWRTSDGRLWERVGERSLAQDGDQRMIAIAALGDRLVAGGWSGTDAAAWASTDLGDTWVRARPAALDGPGLQRIRDVASTGSGFVAVGSDGLPDEEDAAVWTSSDGLTWKPVRDPSFVAAGDQQMWAVDAIGSRLVVVGFTNELGTTDAAVWTYDGSTWSRVSPASLTAPGIQVMLDVAGGSGSLPFVAVGCEDPGSRCDTASATASDAVVWTSSDGSSWERNAEGGRLAAAGDQVMRSLCVYRGDVVAVGSNGGPLGDMDGGVWTSADGVSWRAVPQASPNVTALGGTGDQSLRSVVVYGAHGISLFGFGVSEEPVVGVGRVWSARYLRG